MTRPCASTPEGDQAQPSPPPGATGPARRRSPRTQSECQSRAAGVRDAAAPTSSNLGPDPGDLSSPGGTSFGARPRHRSLPSRCFARTPGGATGVFGFACSLSQLLRPQETRSAALCHELFSRHIVGEVTSTVLQRGTRCFQQETQLIRSRKEWRSPPK